MLDKSRDGHRPETGQGHRLLQVQAIPGDVPGKGVTNALERFVVFRLEQLEPGGHWKGGESGGEFEQLRSELLNLAFLVLQKSDNGFQRNFECRVVALEQLCSPEAHEARAGA